MNRDINTELALLVDGALNHAIYMLDAAGCVTIWNKGAERIKGWREDEIVGRSAEIFYLPEDKVADKMRRELHHARQFGRLEEESLRVRKNGSRFLASVTITALYEQDGRFRGFGKVVRDITEERAAQQEIASREAQLDAILATVPDAMIVSDANGAILIYSATAAAMFGYSDLEMIGRPIAMLMAPGERLFPESNPAATAGHARRRHLGRCRNGRIFPLEVTMGTTRIKDRLVYIGFFRDLTDHEQTETQLQELREELLHVSRVSAMGAMATTLAHELNQPIAAIVNYTAVACDLIAQHDAAVPDGLVRALNEASRESLRAGTIVHRLRDFVARGDVDKRACDLSELILDACALTSVRSDGIGVGFSFQPGIEPVLADRIQIQQLVTNLIRNAADAMRGLTGQRIDITVTRQADDMARVTIADNGFGFEATISDRAFEFFTGSKSDGMGVGLAICRTIVEAHGGRIWIDGAARSGGMIHFTLPLVTGHPVDAD